MEEGSPAEPFVCRSYLHGGKWIWLVPNGEPREKDSDSQHVVCNHSGYRRTTRLGFLAWLEKNGEQYGEPLLTQLKNRAR